MGGRLPTSFREEQQLEVPTQSALPGKLAVGKAEEEHCFPLHAFQGSLSPSLTEGLKLPESHVMPCVALVSGDGAGL